MRKNKKNIKKIRVNLSVVIFGILFVVLIFVGIYFLFSKKTTNVEIKDDPPWFFPAVLEIERGERVVWHLKSRAVHPVMNLEGPVEFHSGHFTKTWSYTFKKPGVYVYICPIHPYMKGVIGVGERVPKDKIPSWVDWPPEDKDAPGGLPKNSGEGDIWLLAQFHKIEGKEKPGSIIIINAKTWEVEKIIDDGRLNNPHNLWEVNGKILVTNWFDLFVSVVDKFSGKIEKHVLVGESPAHIHSHDSNKIYVTLQGDDGMGILNKDFEVERKIRTPDGPHGHWLSSDGRLMALASTENGKISVWYTNNDSIVFEEFVNGEMVEVGEEEHLDEEGEEEHPHSMPLMAGMSLDSRYAFTASSTYNKFYVFDVRKKELVRSFEIGAGPIQTVPTPDGRYVFVPLSGDGALAVISTDNWELIKKIENVGAGAHGVAFGKKEGGGWYAYVSNKFVTWVSVIDVDSLEIAGYIPLPKGAFGGQGILVTD